VSQRLPITTIENVLSNAERRALLHAEAGAVPRVSDIYASLPSLTGKIELEYEGELKGAEQVARELVRKAVATVFDGYATTLDTGPIIDWFQQGGSLELSDTTPAADLLEAVGPIDGFRRASDALAGPGRHAAPVRAAAADFLLEGLCALKKISRTDDGRLLGTPAPPRPRPEAKSLDQMMEDDEPAVKGKKKYYN
jgi:magnesium chelatase subunit I